MVVKGTSKLCENRLLECLASFFPVVPMVCDFALKSGHFCTNARIFSKHQKTWSPTADNLEMEATVMDFETICAKLKSARKDYYTQAEVAALCHLSKKTIYNLEHSGKLAYAICIDRLIHTHKVKTDDVLTMLKERHCRQEQGDLYFYTMKRYYKDKLCKEKDVLEIGDIMRLTEFSKSGVINWLSLRKLQFFRMGKSYMVPKRCLLDFWFSPTHRTIKNKSAVQKADNVVIEHQYHASLAGGDGDE